MLETLTVIRNILLRSFLISIIYTFIVLIVYLTIPNSIALMVSSIYKINPTQVPILIIHFILMIKFFILFVLLFPALAIHWSIIKIDELKAKA